MIWFMALSSYEKLKVMSYEWGMSEIKESLKP